MDLNKGNYESAAQAFQKAVKIDRAVATRTFLTLYARQPEVTLEGRLSRIEKAWPLPRPGELANAGEVDSKTCYEIEEMLEESGPQISPPRQRFLILCLIPRYLGLKHEQKVKGLCDQLLTKYSSQEWNPNEEYFLGYQMLVAHKQGLIPPSYLEQIKLLVSNSFKKWSGEETADDAFSEIFQVVEQGEDHPAREYWGMFEQLADLSPQSYSIPEKLGNHYVNKGQSLEKAQRALVLFGQAEANLNKIPSNDRARVLAWLDLNKGYAYLQMIKYGDEGQRRQDFQDTVKFLRPLLEKIPPEGNGWPKPNAVYELLIEANSWVNDIDEAD